VIKKLSSILILVFLTSCQLAVPDEEGEVETSGATLPFENSAKPDIITGDRYFISNKLVQMFGESESGFIYDKIRLAADVFGGACDKVNPDEACTGADKGRTYTNSSLIKSARMIQVCEHIIGTSSSFDFFLNKASLNSSSDFSKENLEALYRVVFPIKDVNQRFIDILYNQKQTSSLSTSEHWKIAAMALCQSPEWQVL